MKKFILGILLFASCEMFSQSGASTAKLQSAGNATAVAILNKIDTTTKIINKEIHISVATYSAANVAVLGNGTIYTFSIALGSQYWELTSMILVDKGPNYAASFAIYACNDTLTCVDNKAPTWNVARSKKIIGYYLNTSTNNYANSQGRIQVYSVGGGVYNNGHCGIYTGNVYFYIQTLGVIGLANQTENLRILFRKVKE